VSLESLETERDAPESVLWLRSILEKRKGKMRRNRGMEEIDQEEEEACDTNLGNFTRTVLRICLSFLCIIDDALPHARKRGKVAVEWSPPIVGDVVYVPLLAWRSTYHRTFPYPMPHTLESSYFSARVEDVAMRRRATSFK